MTDQITGTVKSCFDNSKEGEYNYAIILNDETRLYYRGFELNPLLQNGDTIKYKVINTKHSKQGNPYTNVSSVEIVNDNAESQSSGTITNNFTKNNTQRLDIFVTGIVGRSMGSGHFSVHDISELTKNAVSAFNENLKEL